MRHQLHVDALEINYRPPLWDLVLRGLFQFVRNPWADVKVSFKLTPEQARQLEEAYSAGRDIHLVLGEQ